MRCALAGLSVAAAGAGDGTMRLWLNQIYLSSAMSAAEKSARM